MAKRQAVIQFAGHQYLVTPGSTITVDKHVDRKEGGQLTVKDVLLYTDGDEVKIGTPNVKDASVTFKVKELKRGPKIKILRFRAKSRYRRRMGHRQPQTELEVSKISA